LSAAVSEVQVRHDGALVWRGDRHEMLDALQPSDVPYYSHLTTGLAAKGWHAGEIDFCDAISAAGPQLIRNAAAAVAAAAVH